MRRRAFIGALGGAAAWPLAARAQPARKPYRIGILETVSAALNAANLNAFRQGLRELRYTEGEDFLIDYRSADGHPERFPDMAAELVRLNVDVIVTRGTPAALAAKKVTATIPVIMAGIAEPLAVVASLSHPGGNVTGLSAFVKDLQAKRVEFLKETVPGIARIAALVDMGNPVVPAQWDEIATAARALGLAPQLLDVRTREQLEPAFAAASRDRVDAVLVGIDTVTSTNRELIASLAVRHRLPAIYASKDFVEAGGLIAYGVNYPDLYRRAAIYVDKVLRGTRPADLPVEQPTKFELVINFRTAKALGLELPPTLLALADEVIE